MPFSPTIDKMRTMRSKNLFRVTLVIGLLAVGTMAQTVEQAEALAAEQEHEEALEAYRSVVSVEPENGRAWYGMGQSLQSLGRYEEALEAFDEAGDLGFRKGGVLFRKGTIYLEMGRIEDAKTSLSRAAENGVPVFRLSKSFPSFEKVKDDAEFAAYLSSLAPCTSAEYDHFDFWLGEWDVYNPSGQKVGENTIEKILDGCVVYETWTGAGGSAGRSFNRWDPETETWNQHWVNDHGTEIIMSGGFEDGKMVLETAEGVEPKQRWTWYEIEPGKVRQMATQTTDGETWNVIWDSVYIPKESDWQPVELD